MTDSVRKIAEAVTKAGATGALLRIATVTGLEPGGTRVRLDITGTAWVAVDADVVGLADGQRVYAMQQGPVTVVSGRLTGTPPPAVPVGALTLYAGSSTAVPAGYLLCQGQSLLRSEFAALFAVIGTTYGSSAGDRFSLPNLQDRVPVGVSGGKGRGATGGAERVTLSEAQMPGHDHGSSGAHTHTVSGAGGVQTSQSGVGATSAEEVGSNTGSAGGHTHGWRGNNESHENMQPWVALYYMIRAT